MSQAKSKSLPATQPEPERVPMPVAPKTEVLPVTREGGRAPLPTAGGRPVYWCSFDPSTPAGKVMLQNCLDEPIVNSDEWLRRPVEVEHLFGHEVEVVDPTTGEVIQAQRVVAIAPNGDTASCCSSGVLNSLKWIVEMEGEPPWKPARHIRLVAGKSRRGFRFFKMRLEMTLDPQP